MKIIRVASETKNDAIRFLKKSREILFPTLTGDPVLDDFDNIFLNQFNAALLIAVSDDNVIVGTIGLRAFNNRFTELNYTEVKTAEIIKLFVDPSQRRKNIASILLDEVIKTAKEMEYQMLYLHTHPFLDGALDFWQSHGFQITWWDSDSQMETVHMERKLLASDLN